MALNFLPGRPNDTPQTVCQVCWCNQTIFAYCSGNSLIVMSNGFTRLQTIYLQSDCHAVDINPKNGFIAVGFSDKVYIYRPIYPVMSNPKWTFCCEIFHDSSLVNSLKWGADNEIVIGSDFLSFWKVNDEFGEYKPVLLWNKRHPVPVFMVTISNDSQFIASFGKFDTTVKLWKRIPIGGEQDIFTLSLLPHPNYVTMIKWKNVIDSDNDNDNNNSNETAQLLYTLCSDKVLRFWSCHEVEENQKCVQHRGYLQLRPEQKFCFIIDNWIVRHALLADNNGSNTESNGTLEDQIKLENYLDQDVVVCMSAKGTFEVFTEENLWSNLPLAVKHRRVLTGAVPPNVLPSSCTFLYIAEPQPYSNTRPTVSLILHSLVGVIRHCTVDIRHLLGITQAKSERNFDHDHNDFFELHHIFAGHNKTIQRLTRSKDGEALFTVSRFSENCIWRPKRVGKNLSSLYLKNIVSTEVPIRLSVLLERGALLICLLENNKIQAWECSRHRDPNDTSAALRAEYLLPLTDGSKQPLLMFNTPEQKHSHERHFIAIVYSDGSVNAFEVSLTRGIFKVDSGNLDFGSGKHASKGETIGSEKSMEDGVIVSTIDPVHQTFASNKPLIAVCTKTGIVRTYKAKVHYDERYVEWTMDSELTTGIGSPSFLKGSSTSKLCMVDSTGKVMSLWDMNRGVLEYQESFDDAIEDVDWISTEQLQSIVSIGFSCHALLYTQLRYDYTNNTPSYLPIEKIDITSNTDRHINDSIWLKEGMFVVASGNQLYIKDKTLDLRDTFTHRSIGSREILSNDILHLNSVLNGPLPVYHPQFLIQALYFNKLQLIKEILLRLFLMLRDIDLHSKDIAPNLPSDLNIASYKFFIVRDKDYKVEKFPDPYPTFNKAVSAGLIQLLTKKALPYLTRHQQITLMIVVEAVQEIVDNESVLDFRGFKFLLGVRLFLSHKHSQDHLLMRDVSWALHSDNKSLLLSMFDSKIRSWKAARDYKIAYWATEGDLIRKFEEFAKFEFSTDDKKDPSRCSIFYLALKRKQILINLWKISIGHPEQQKMLKFLSNDFTQPRWVTAALKNAFVLLSKHRYMDAASFFLLAGSLKDSVNVLYKQVDDLDLAIAVCRVYEGDNGPVLGQFLTTQLLPKAGQDGDKWLTSFIYWKLRRQHVAIKALVTAPIDLENNAELVDKEKVVNRSFLVEDPALLYLYAHLRERNINYFVASLELGKQNEYNLILRTVDILCRMGCNLLSVSLVGGWKFIKPPKTIPELATATPKRTSVPSIDAMVYEPTKTQRVRPSLFDMFDSESGSASANGPSNVSNTSDLSSNTGEDSGGVRNILDMYSRPTTSTTEPGNSANTEIQKAKDLLDEFRQSSNPKLSIGLGNAVNSVSSPGKPKSLLDQYEMPEIYNKTQTPVPKPRNLLDDFM